jgi:predicted transcriptional regulator
MKHMPCEFIVWHGLPIIRKKIAESIIVNHNLTQKETAKILSLTPAAVSQYLCGKRGELDISDKEICKEIDKSAERIFQKGNKVLVAETCRLCKIFKSKNQFSFINKIRGNHRYANDKPRSD